MTTIGAGGHRHELKSMWIDDTPREQLDAEAIAIYRLFAEREREFAVGSHVVVDYSPATDQPGGLLADPVGYIAGRVAALEDEGAISRIVVLTTYGQYLREPLAAAGYAVERIDMPAGPDHTYAFTLDRGVGSGAGRVLYLEVVDEADDKIRPTFVLKLVDGEGQLCGGACGAVHMVGGRRYVYLSMLTLARGLPPGTGTRLGEALLDMLRRRGVAAVHLGTQTAGRFYEKLGFRVTHRLVSGLRRRTKSDGSTVSDDLVMLTIEL